jgi:Sulfotransferase family
MRTAKDFSNALVHRVLNRCYLDYGDYRSTVLVAGTGRSGTTWLEDIINFRHDHRILFEPFHSKEVPSLSHWHYRQYLRPAETAERFRAPARRILSGRIRNAWVDQFNTKHFVSKRLVKDIRANLLLGWIHEQFPEIPIVLLIRHPCAVASSKLALGWSTHLADFTSQPDLVEDHLQPFLPVLESARDDFDRHVLLWCVENLIPLRQFADGEIHVCFYEQLCAQPDREARSLCTYLRRDFDPASLASLSRPSALSKQHSAILNGGDLLNAWRKHIAPSQVERAIDLLSAFGLDKIYDGSSMPKVRGDDALSLFEPAPTASLAPAVALDLPVFPHATASPS